MGANLVARSSVNINAPQSTVWDALTNPAAIKEYMFGADVVTTWQEGSPVTWKGAWKGKPYEDKGVVVRFRPEKLLQYTHYSPLSGLDDKPENHHTVTVELSTQREQTRVLLSQDNNATEEARQHSQHNWDMMLAALKTFVEGAARQTQSAPPVEKRT